MWCIHVLAGGHVSTWSSVPLTTVMPWSQRSFPKLCYCLPFLEMIQRSFWWTYSEKVPAGRRSKMLSPANKRPLYFALRQGSRRQVSGPPDCFTACSFLKIIISKTCAIIVIMQHIICRWTEPPNSGTYIWRQVQQLYSSSFERKSQLKNKIMYVALVFMLFQDGEDKILWNSYQIRLRLAFLITFFPLEMVIICFEVYQYL